VGWRGGGWGREEEWVCGFSKKCEGGGWELRSAVIPLVSGHLESVDSLPVEVYSRVVKLFVSAPAPASNLQKVLAPEPAPT
jgi:hypothetical protein